MSVRTLVDPKNTSSFLIQVNFVRRCSIVGIEVWSFPMSLTNRISHLSTLFIFLKNVPYSFTSCKIEHKRSHLTFPFKILSGTTKLFVLRNFPCLLKKSNWCYATKQILFSFCIPISMLMCVPLTTFFFISY